MFIGEAPAALIFRNNWQINLVLRTTPEGAITLSTLSFTSQFLKNCINYRGAILWNAGPFTVFKRKVKKGRILISRSVILAHSRSNHSQGTTKILNVLTIMCLNAVVNLLWVNKIIYLALYHFIMLLFTSEFSLYQVYFVSNVFPISFKYRFILNLDLDLFVIISTLKLRFCYNSSSVSWTS